jgi:DNA-binding transcriptional ArsR family regulator
VSAGFVCKHCGHIDWSYAPVALEVKQLLERRGALTSSAVADALRLSISNAVNHLNRLIALGLVTRSDAQRNPSGGRYRLYSATTEAAAGSAVLAVDPSRSSPNACAVSTYTVATPEPRAR